MLDPTVVMRHAKTLVAHGLGTKTQFGQSLAVNPVGIAVGAPLHKEGMGSVMVFNRQTFVYEETLAPDPKVLLFPKALFGQAIGLYGTSLIVGAPGESAIYIFERGKSSWEFVYKHSLGVEWELGVRVAMGKDWAIADCGKSKLCYVYEKKDGKWDVQSIFGQDIPEGAEERTHGTTSDGNFLRFTTFEQEASPTLQAESFIYILKLGSAERYVLPPLPINANSFFMSETGDMALFRNNHNPVVFLQTNGQSSRLDMPLGKIQSIVFNSFVLVIGWLGGFSLYDLSGKSISRFFGDHEEFGRNVLIDNDQLFVTNPVDNGTVHVYDLINKG